MGRRRNKAGERRIARDRVAALLRLAREAAKDHPERAHRYAGLARRVAMRYQVNLTRSQKQQICRRCDHYLLAGITSRHRTRGGRLVVTCGHCSNVVRRPLQVPRKETKVAVEVAA